MERKDKVLCRIRKDQIGLEIGASYSPIARKADGWHIEVADYLDAESLKKKYEQYGVDCGLIESVDHIIEGSKLHESVGKTNHYDFIIASHVIEHTTDMISFVRDCSQMLKDDGVLSLVVPDKRFCFDVFQPLTTVGSLIQAFHEKRTMHPLGKVFDQLSLHALLDGNPAWFSPEIERIALVHDLKDAQRALEHYVASGTYHDLHAWHFNYWSFLGLMQDLYDLQYVDMGVAASFPTVGFEFYITLIKGEPGQRFDRLTCFTNAYRDVGFSE